LALFDVKCKSYAGCDTRIQVVQQRSPKKILYLDRDAEFETTDRATDRAVATSQSDRGKNKFRLRSGLTTSARQTLQRIGGVVGLACTPRSSVFLTGTFPGSSHSAQTAIASQAHWIVHRLKAWLYKRIGKNIGYYVWEFQKRGTLHLHYVVLVPDEVLRARIISDFRDEWIRLIAGASKRSGENLFLGNKGRDFFTEKEKLQIYAQECYKDCSSYLSKYLAKKSSSNFPAPCRLWGCTREARNLVAKHLISFSLIGKSLAVADDFAHKLDSYSSVSAEKRRYFRHRFSQGFTILLYDDNIRSALEDSAIVPSPVCHLHQRVVSLYYSLVKFNLIDYLRENSSAPMMGDLSCIVGSPFSRITVAQWVAFFYSSIELKALVGRCPTLTRYQKNELRNKLNIIQSELTDMPTMSALRKIDAVMPSIRKASEDTTSMAVVSDGECDMQMSIVRDD